MTAAEILDGFPKLSALVVGDICLDRWCRYDPALAEPSRETGIPRIAVVATRVTPGAAGTVANNLAALKVGRIGMLGAIGGDGFGFELLRELEAIHVSAEYVVRSPAVPTFTYTKLINTITDEEDQPRVDFINPLPIPPDVEHSLAQHLREAADHYDAILVSDQAETTQGGTITAQLRGILAELALQHPKKIVWVDSRVRSELFRNVIVKPNREEAEAASLRALGRVDYPALRRHMRAKLLLVTHGPLGALLVHEQGEEWAKTQPVEKPVDICGAGDSFSAGAACALAITGSPREAARFGNLVASITIMKKGTGTASPEEVLAADRGWPE
ncbi:MAG TPA: PfkB family carbohydrate kinase [Bryobacteraceae bacterium]|nr:PfkB family carbohydrate kinase [Bryobacteraceae bacterium]